MGSLLDSVVSFVGRPFGIYTHDETFTDIQISNLLTPDVADNAARKSAIRNSGGNANNYFTAYRAFQRQYKRRYSRKFLEGVGYAPSSTATTRVIDNTLLQSYMQTDFGYSVISIEKAQDLYLNDDKKVKYGRQFVTGYDLVTGLVTSGGLDYAYSTFETVSPTEITLKFVRNFNDTIIDNLTTNYSYDNIAGTVVINSETYNVGVISSVVNGNDEYETVCVHTGGTLPDETILTPVQRFQENYSNVLFDNEVTYVEYRVTSGEVPNVLSYAIYAADTLTIYTQGNIDVTAIIPMKENNVIVNEDNKLKRVLKKLNLSHEQLVESLDNPDLDAAYLMTALDTNIDDDIHNRVMFQMFDLITEGSGSITISISELDLLYSFNIDKTTHSGVISDVGTYTRLAATSSGVTLYYQGSATEYQEIVISDYLSRYTISGNTLQSGFNSPDNRLVIPIDIFNSLRYRDWVHIYERSLCMLGYAVEVVEIKWYETAAFGFLLQIVGFVLALPSGGASLTFVEIVKALAINFLIAQVVVFLADVIGGDLGAIIAAVVAIYFATDGNLFNASAGSEIWLEAAIVGLTTITQAKVAQAQEALIGLQEQIEVIDDKLKEIKDKLKETEDNSILYATNTIPFESVGRPSKIFQTTEQYVESIVNTEWLVDGSWMYDIDGEIAARNSVYVG